MPGRGEWKNKIKVLAFADELYYNGLLSRVECD